MRSFAAAAIAVLMACHALAQDDPVETRSFAVSFLTLGQYRRWEPALGLVQDAIGTAVAAGEEAGGILLSREDLVAVLKREIAPASWKAPGARMEAVDVHLVATNRRSVLDAAAAWLANARSRYGRRLSIDAAVVIVPPERWGRVEPKDLPGVSKILQSFRLTTSSGRPVVGQRIRQLSYVRDHDVQISSAAGALDPIIDVLSTGTRIDLAPWIDPVGDGVLFEVRAETAAFESMDDRALKLLKHEPVAEPAAAAAGAAAPPPAILAKPWEAVVQLPRIAIDTVRGQVRARAGETVVAASASRADGVWALLLTPSFLDGDPAAPLPGTRFYEVGGVVSKIQDFPAPKPYLVSPQRGGGGPLTGATFTLDEPREGYGEERLRDALRAVVDPPGTPLEASGVESTYGNAIAVRAGHAAAEKVLAEAFRRETRTVTTEAAILAFRPGAKALWAKTVPALAPGGERAAVDAMARLFEEAGKGGDVRLAGTISVSGRVSQQVYATSGRQRSYVQDFEPQVSSYASQGDPIISVLVTGLGLEARPVPFADGGLMAVALRCWSLSGDVADDKLVSTGLGPVQRATVEGPRWDVDVLCAPNHWTLAGLESRDGEDWALFVRVKD